MAWLPLLPRFADGSACLREGSRAGLAHENDVRVQRAAAQGVRPDTSKTIGAKLELVEGVQVVGNIRKVESAGLGEVLPA